MKRGLILIFSGCKSYGKIKKIPDKNIYILCKYKTEKLNIYITYLSF